MWREKGGSVSCGGVVCSRARHIYIYIELPMGATAVLTYEHYKCDIIIIIIIIQIK